MNHFITLEKAKQMNARYRNEKENILAENYRGQNILAICESFDRSAFDRVLSQQGCTGIRIYYGMDEQDKVHAVVVGFDINGHDILPTAAAAAIASDGEEFEGIIEEGNRCPDMCPPESPLNEDENQP
ncbi:MAG TPA: hypothetical protein VMR70_16290 [Flavisolibacter sp.]|nr:hypothetical protein [Flavisolibacter sp.]